MFVGTAEFAGQPGFGRASSRSIAPVMTPVQGQWRANLRCRRRAIVTSWAAAEKRRSLLRRGSHPRFAGQGEHGYPGQQVQSDLHDLQPDLVLSRLVQGQVAQAGGAGVSDAVLGPCALTVSQTCG